MKHAVVLLFLFSLNLKAQLRIVLREDTAEAFIYGGGDEFNATTLNETVWKGSLAGRSVLMAQDLAFDKSKVKLKDGLLLCLADTCDTLQKLQDWEIDKGYLNKTGQTMNNNEWRVRYRTGGIVSKEKLHYGIHELRFKVQANQGVWPAFWFFGGVKNEEIDVFELKGERLNEVHVDVHCPSGCDHGYRKTSFSLPASYGAWLPTTGQLKEGFQVMSVDWRENELCFYLNGQALAYFRGSFANPMNLFINTSVAKDGEGFDPGPNKKNVWPDTFSVDYYRFWKKASLLDTVRLIKESVASNQSYGALLPEKETGIMFRRRRLMQQKGELTIFRNAAGQLLLHSTTLARKEIFQVQIKSLSKTEVVDVNSHEVLLGNPVGPIELSLIRKKAMPLRFQIVCP